MSADKQGRGSMIINLMLCGLLVLLMIDCSNAQQIESLNPGEGFSSPESINRAEVDLRGNYYFISGEDRSLWKWGSDKSANLLQANEVETEINYSPAYADLEVTNGLKIYAADTENNRIHVFERHMDWIGTINPVSNDGQSSLNPDLIAVDDQNRLYVYDGDRQALRRYDEYGTPDRAFSLPMDISERMVDMEISSLGLIAIDQQGNLHQISVLGRYERSMPLSRLLDVNNEIDSEIRLHATGQQLLLVYGDQLLHIDERLQIAQQWTMSEVRQVVFADGWAAWISENMIHRMPLSGINDLKSLLLTDNK